MPDAARPPKKPSPTFPVYWKEWLTGATFLSLEARGAHATLMMLCWEHELIPSSLAALAPACGTDLATMERVWPSIARFYQPAGSLMTCPSVEESRSGQARFRSAQTVKSALGVAAKRTKRTRGSKPGKAGVQPGVQPQSNPDSTLAVATATAASSAEALSPPAPEAPPAVASPTRQFTDAWGSLFARHREGSKYAFEGSKDGAHVRAILELSSGDIPEAMRRAEVHLTDPFWAERGANLGTFRANWNRCVHGHANGHRNDKVGHAAPSTREEFGNGRVEI